MNLNFALVEENRGLRIFILRVNRRNFFVERRLAQARDPQHPPHHFHRARPSPSVEAARGLQTSDASRAVVQATERSRHHRAR